MNTRGMELKRIARRKEWWGMEKNVMVGVSVLTLALLVAVCVGVAVDDVKGGDILTEASVMAIEKRADVPTKSGLMGEGYYLRISSQLGEAQEVKVSQEVYKACLAGDRVTIQYRVGGLTGMHFRPISKSACFKPKQEKASR